MTTSAEWRRGFSVESQKLAMKVNVEQQALIGYTEIIIKPDIVPPPRDTNPAEIPLETKYVQLRELRLHSRQCKIKHVSVNGTTCTFELFEFLGRIAPESVGDLKSYSALYAGDLEASEQGELMVMVPTEHVDNSNSGNTLELRIEYELRKPLGAILFGTSKTDDGPISFMYSATDICGGNTIGGGCGARCWFPCVDTVQSRFPCDLQFTVDEQYTAVSVGDLLDIVLSDDGKKKTFIYKHAEPIAPHNISVAIGPFETYINPILPWVTHFCLPGKLESLKQTTNGLSKIFHHFADYLGAAFPYSSYKQVFLDEEFINDDASSYSTLAILSDSLLHSDFNAGDPYKWKSKAIQARCIASNYFGALVPIMSHSDAWLILGFTGFLELLYIKKFVGESSASEYLMDCANRVITAEKRSVNVALQHTAAGSTMGRTLIQPEPAKYPVDSALWAARGIEYNSVISSKALVIMHILEANVTSNIFRLTIRDYVISAIARLPQNVKAFQTMFGKELNKNVEKEANDEKQLKKRKSIKFMANHDEKPKSYADVDKELRLGEAGFMSKLRASAGHHGSDINRKFVNQWLRHSGYPKFVACVQYQKPKNAVDINMTQEILPGGRRFQGTFRITVVEDDASWGYEKTVETSNVWTIGCHSQPQKKKKGRKKKGENVEEQWKDPEVLKSPDKLLNLVAAPRSRKTGSGKRGIYWENDTPVRYVRLDPKMCWIRDLELICDEFMLLELLNDKDPTMMKDVLNQCFALEQLSRTRFPDDKRGQDASVRPTPVLTIRSVAVLAGVLVSSKKPERVRATAALNIATWQNNYAPATPYTSTPNTSWIGLELLITCFRELFCVHGAMVPNDFTVKGESVIKPAFARAFSLIKAQNGEPPERARDIVLEMICDNDNSTNDFSDGQYLAELLDCATTMVVRMKLCGAESNPKSAKSAIKFRDKVLQILNRNLDYDALAPSPKYIITAACLKALGRIEGAKVVPAVTPYFAYAVYAAEGDAERNLFSSHVSYNKKMKEATMVAKTKWGVLVREAAFEAIVQTYIVGRIVSGATWMNIFKWLIEAIAADPCPLVQRKVIKILLKFHADTANDLHEALDFNKSPSGAFWPLSNAPSDMDEKELKAARKVARRMWSFLNEGSMYDSRFRIGMHQLWRVIWGLETPSILMDIITDYVDLGPFAEWVEDFEDERGRDTTEANAAAVEQVMPYNQKMGDSKKRLHPGGGGNTVFKLKLI